MVFNSNLIDFFKRHNLYDKEMFDYFSKNSSMIDYQDEEQRMFIGTFYGINKKTRKLVSIHLNVPYVYNDITMLISIHEIVHAILLYKRLNKKTNLGIDYEALPMLYEKIYINETNTKEIIEYGKWLDSLITPESEEYIFGLNVRDELFNNYNYDIDKMNKIVKKLVKKYKHY